MRTSLLWSLNRTWELLSDGALALLLFAAVGGVFWFVGQLLADPTAADTAQPLFRDAVNAPELRLGNPPRTQFSRPAAPNQIR
jgi:hypothetical protein